MSRPVFGMAAVEWSGTAGKTAGDELIDAVKNDHADVRVQAIAWLGRWDVADKRVNLLLLECRQDPALRSSQSSVCHIARLATGAAARRCRHCKNCSRKWMPGEIEQKLAGAVPPGEPGPKVERELLKDPSAASSGSRERDRAAHG